MTVFHEGNDPESLIESANDLATLISHRIKTDPAIVLLPGKISDLAPRTQFSHRRSVDHLAGSKPYFFESIDIDLGVDLPKRWFISESRELAGKLAEDGLVGWTNPLRSVAIRARREREEGASFKCYPLQHGRISPVYPVGCTF